MENSSNKQRSDSPIKHEYKTISDIYLPVHKRLKKIEEFRCINVIGIFVAFKESCDSIILEDNSHDSYFYIRVLNPSIKSLFRSYFRPGFIFRFLNVDCTAIQTPSPFNPKSVRINCSDINTVVVFEWVTNSENDKFTYYNSPNPMILPTDWEVVNRLRKEWCWKINNVSINDLKRILLSNKKSECENVTFMAQIVEIKQPAPRKLILKIWDGTSPDFEVRLPINQADLNSGPEDFQPAREIDPELEKKSTDKAMYVLVVGNKVGSFLNKRPGEYVLLIKAKIYYYNKIYPNIFRCELNDNNRLDYESFQWVLFIKNNSNLGKLLTTKLRSSNSISAFELEATDNNTQNNLRIERNDSFEQIEDRNIIIKVQKFDEIKQDRNYQIFCKIVDVFPLNYTVFDLINLQCKHCNLDDSIRNLFEMDLEGLRRAAGIFLIQYGLNRNDVNCPNCLRAKANFKFFIVFLLEDENEEQMIALLEGDYCDRFFELNPLEVLAYQEYEEIFSQKFQDLLNIFNNFKESPIRHMIINKSKKHYSIKSISIKRNLVL